jgi:hypothetical protein
MPARRAIERVLQRVAFLGASSSVKATSQRQGDQPFDRRVADGPRRPGARRVHQPLQPVRGEAPAPGRHRLAADAQGPGHAQVGRAGLGAGQHDPDALGQGQGLADAAPAQQTLQLGPLGLGQLQRHGLGSTRHDAPPHPGRVTFPPICGEMQPNF